MSKVKRSMKSHQLDVRLLQMEVSSAGAALAVSGMDDSAIDLAQSTYNGIGEVTLVLKKPFSAANPDKPKIMATALEANRAAYLVASAHDRVTIQITDLAGAPAEGSISIMIMGTNHRFCY